MRQLGVLPGFRLTVLLAVAPLPPRVGLYAAPLSLDPHVESDFVTSGVLANTFDGLTSLDADLRVEPALAVSWDTPAASTWRFRLRPGARMEFREDRNAEEIQRQLAEAGFDVALRPLPWGEAVQRLRSSQIPFYYGAMVADTSDAGDLAREP